MLDEIAFEVFGITAELDSSELDYVVQGTQREFCERVAELFARPPWAAKYALRAIVSQLELCGYENELVRWS